MYRNSEFNQVYKFYWLSDSFYVTLPSIRFVVKL